MKIAFIGGGNMAEAMLAAVLAKALAKPTDVRVSDVLRDRISYLEKNYRITATADNLEATRGAEVVVLAVKPQNLPEVMAELGGNLEPSQLVLSIIAGARISTISQGLKHERVIRAMPNTPARIGQGMSVWTATAEVGDKQKRLAADILGAMGRQVFFEDEKYIDMATAISGSGPAYVFLFMESLIDAAVDIGLPRGKAKEMVLQMVLGSVKFASASTEELGELRRRVTSPGGTTAEALKQFEEGRFAELIKRAVRAAYNKARSLGG